MLVVGLLDEALDGVLAATLDEAEATLAISEAETGALVAGAENEA